MVLDVNRIPSRQSLAVKPQDGYARSDFADIDMVFGRVRAWRNGRQGLSSQACPMCIPARDALACKPAVEVTFECMSSLYARHFNVDADLLERLTSSRKESQEFAEGHWDHVLTAPFVFQIQPLNPGLQPFLISFSPPKTARPEMTRPHC
jgi:hypothetical protein